MQRREFISSVLAAAPGLEFGAGPQQSSGDTDAVLARRKQYLDDLLKILPRSTSTALSGRMNGGDKVWEDWLRRTGELPPDFESMPSIPGLADPLVLNDSRITTVEQWRRRRESLRAEFERWVYGRMPPPPGNLRAVVTGTHTETRVTVREVRLEFGPNHAAQLHVHLFIPDGKGPFPVFLTNQPRTAGWIYPAVRRGYAACTYDATDPIFGPADDSDKFIDIYPDYDFACIARWAWAAMRVVDYLTSIPEVDANKIGITGHSRNSKQALLATAFDERIAAVAASSGTTGECLPWRYTTNMFWGTGSIESITGGPHNTHWFHPRLRFFAGRENRLPVDQHLLMAMVAPRGLLMHAAYSEHEGNAFGYEQAYRSAREVYRLLGREQNVWLHLREGEHDFTPNGTERFVNFFDTIFGRANFPKLETWVSGYTFERWRQASGERSDPLAYAPQSVEFGVSSHDEWERRKPEILKAVHWALGEEPAGLPFQPVTKLPAPATAYWLHESTDNELYMLFRRPLRGQAMGSAMVPYGDGLRADLYYPLAGDGTPKPGKLPVVIWLHAFAYAQGYSRWAGPAFAALTQRGFAILAFDQLGFGLRARDARYFSEQYPKWSLMGRMVADTRAAIDAVAGLEMIDASRISLIGYSLGAKVGLLTAALDNRVRALAAVCGFDALRLNTPEKGTDTVRELSHLHGLMPRLGFFAENESRLPFDFNQALALIAPRPVKLIAPVLDCCAPVEDVRREVEACRKVYRLLGAESALEFDTPLDFNRFARPRQEQVIDWIARAV
jgi:pimeloyl-ACP methyl ester carboxylesterase